MTVDSRLPEGPRIEAIDRALTLLTALAESGPSGSSLSELALSTGVNKSTAYRALSTMRAHGFVDQSADSGDYRLGAAAMRLGDRFVTPTSLTESLHPALVALAREADELVHLGVLVGDDVLYLDKVEPERAIRVWSEVGRRAVAVTTAMGRAMLAARGVPDELLGPYLHRSSMTVEALAAIVHEARVTGFASEFEENERGVACIGVALLQGSHAVAALSITMQAERMTSERRTALERLVHAVVPPLLPPAMSLYRGAAG